MRFSSSTSSAPGRIYAANTSGNSVTVYPPNPDGHLRNFPLGKIEGSLTHLDAPIAIALDASGRIYVVNSNNSVTVYAANPRGPVNEAPVAVIAGSRTELDGPSAIAVDASGKIYVTNKKDSKITVYAPNPSGALNETPVASISGADTELQSPLGLALDASGKIFVLNYNDRGASLFFPRTTVTVYAAKPSGVLHESPMAMISSTSFSKFSTSTAIALDTADNVYVFNPQVRHRGSLFEPAVSVFAAPIGIVNETPFAQIVGDRTGFLPSLGTRATVAVDTSGRVYVNLPRGNIRVFPPVVDGENDVFPLATITGDHSRLTGGAIAIH